MIWLEYLERAHDKISSTTIAGHYHHCHCPDHHQDHSDVFKRSIRAPTMRRGAEEEFGCLSCPHPRRLHAAKKRRYRDWYEGKKS
jgi:hypothetical protein